MVGSAIDEYGRIDILVNNAGTNPRAAGLGSGGQVPFWETSAEAWSRVVSINFSGPFFMSQAVVGHLLAQKWGRIISVSSIYGREYGGSIDYMTGKAALIAFSKHMALNLVKENVLVNCIAPGSIDFPGSSWDRFQQNSTPEEVAEFIDRNLPAGRFGWPEPIGDTVAFLASENANLITGTCLNVDGGQSRSLF